MTLSRYSAEKGIYLRRKYNLAQAIVFAYDDYTIVSNKINVWS